MHYQLNIYSLDELPVSGMPVLNYFNVEEGDTREELYHAVEALYNQQSRIYSITMKESEGKLIINTIVNKRWNALNFSKRKNRKRLRHKEEMTILQSKFNTGTANKFKLEKLWSFDMFIDYLF